MGCAGANHATPTLSLHLPSRFCHGGITSLAKKAVAVQGLVETSVCNEVLRVFDEPGGSSQDTWGWAGIPIRCVVASSKTC